MTRHHSSALATRLHEIAVDVEKLDIDDLENFNLYMTLNGGDEPTRRARVDLLAAAILGASATTSKPYSSWRYGVSDDSSSIRVNIYTDIEQPAEEDPAALRARIAELSAELATRTAGESA